MKLVYKKDMVMVDGMLVDSNTNETIFVPGLANQANEIFEMVEVLDFISVHKTEIESAGKKKVKFSPSEPAAPRFTTGKTVATPLIDAAKAEAEAIALEFLNKELVANVDLQLQRYQSIAEWLDKDYVVVIDTPIVNHYKGDILTLDEATVLATVEAFRDPDNQKLIKALDISRA